MIGTNDPGYGETAKMDFMLKNNIAYSVLTLGIFLAACGSTTGSGGSGGDGASGGTGGAGGANGGGGAGGDCQDTCWESDPGCFPIDVPEGSFQCGEVEYCDLSEICIMTIDDIDCNFNTYDCEAIEDEEDPCAPYVDGDCFDCGIGDDGGYLVGCY